MPTTKTTITKTTKRKYNKKAKRGYKRGRAISRVPRIRTYAYKRSQEMLLAMEAPSDNWINIVPTEPDGSVDPQGYCLVKTFTFSLAELDNASEFSNLYRQYKLNHAVVKFFPSYSQVVLTTGPVATTNLIITIWPNTDGQGPDSTFRNKDLLEIQGKRQFLVPQNRPTTMSMPLKQLRNTFGGVDTDGDPLTAYAVKKPSYITTAQLDVPHYGFNVHIRKVDGSAFTSNGPRFLIKESIYLSTRQVH